MDKIYPIDITPSNWKKYETEIVALEEQYPPDLQSDSDDFYALLCRRGTIARALVAGGSVAGFVIGCILSGEQIHDYQLEELFTDEMLYLESITVAERFQGKGFGGRLMSDFVQEARRGGFKKIVGHFRQNGSVALIRKSGAREIFTVHNWQGTGEDYCYCELALKTE
jgi:GNAT superfamily N-acetyltransferase